MNLAADFFYDEVRDGFYIPGMMKRAWGAEYRVLTEIDRICKKNAIPYHISAGTLLGAVREGNFIPWDDDIDIIMLRDAFSRFQEVVRQELPSEMTFFYGEEETDYSGFLPVVGVGEMRFRKKVLKEFCEFPYPVGVDIFVLDDLAKDPEKEAQRKEKLDALFDLIDMVEKGKESEEALQKSLASAEKLLHRKWNTSGKLLPELYRVFHEICQEFHGEGEEVAYLPYQLYHPETKFPKKAFQGTKNLPFCGTAFPVPAEYDTVLKVIYGEYRVPAKAGGEHNYPYFKKYEERLRKDLQDKWFFDYVFQEKDMERPRVENFREISRQFADAFVREEEELEKAFSEGQFEAVLSALPSLQERAVMLGNAVEERKGEGTESVRILESFCEALFQLHSSLTAAQASAPEQCKEQLEGLRPILGKLRTALEREFKRQVVFLPHSAKHFASLRPLIDALQEREDTEVKLMPIPYFDRLGDGSLSEMHYEGENFPKEYPITDYRSYNFAAELPDCIVMNSPYDAYNPVWSVDPFFYSEKLKQYTNKLVYIPWFVTDEIDPKNPEDGKAFYNMRYYVTVPGIMHADLTIVQSKEMRKAYSAKLSRFLDGGKRGAEGKEKTESLLARKEQMRVLRKKIVGAGSCLFGEKEGQGTREVISCFTRFLSR